jgi:protein-tyrosine phosphatase
VKHSSPPLNESYWVKPGRFLAGEYPGHWDERRTSQRLDSLLEAGIDTFIDLTRLGELPPYLPVLEERAGYYNIDLRYHNFPIPDHGLPTIEIMRTILDAIDSALAEGRNVYVHCWGGIGRTGTTVGCYLVRHGMSSNEALRQLSDWWQEVPKHIFHPYTPETDKQMDFILAWKENE